MYQPVERHRDIMVLLLCDGVETLWEKKKMLTASIFSFSHILFKRLLSQGCIKAEVVDSTLGSVKRSFLYPSKTNVFGGILESVYLSVSVSVCVQNTYFFQSWRRYQDTFSDRSIFFFFRIFTFLMRCM